MYYRTVGEYQTESSRLLMMPSATSSSSSVPSALGRYRSKIIRTATTAAESLLRAVTCSGESDVADGFKDIWNQNEAACTSFVTYTASALRPALFELIENDDRTIGVNGWVAINQALKAAYEIATELFAADAVGGSGISTGMGAGREGEGEPVHPVILALEELIQLQLPQADSSSPTPAGAMAMDTEDDPAASTSSGNCYDFFWTSYVLDFQKCDIGLSNAFDRPVLLFLY